MGKPLNASTGNANDKTQNKGGYSKNSFEESAVCDIPPVPYLRSLVCTSTHVNDA